VRDCLSPRFALLVVLAQAGGVFQQPKAGHPVSSVLDCRVTAIGLACGGLPPACRPPGHFSLCGQREVTKRKATPISRPCGVADGRRGGSTGHPALTIHWLASMPATLRAIPPPACSRHRGGEVKGQREEQIFSLQERTQCATATHQRPLRSRTGCAPTKDGQLSVRCAAKRHEPSHIPLCGGEGWTSRPRRGARHGCRALFVRAGARSKSPAAPHGLAGRSPDSAMRGALLFGYFLLGTQEKVTRAAAALRKPAAGEPSSGIATTKDGRNWVTRLSRPRHPPASRSVRPAPG